MRRVTPRLARCAFTPASETTSRVPRAVSRQRSPSTRTSGRSDLASAPAVADGCTPASVALRVAARTEPAPRERRPRRRRSPTTSTLGARVEAGGVGPHRERRRASPRCTSRADCVRPRRAALAPYAADPPDASRSSARAGQRLACRRAGARACRASAGMRPRSADTSLLAGRWTDADRRTTASAEVPFVVHSTRYVRKRRRADRCTCSSPDRRRQLRARLEPEVGRDAGGGTGDESPLEPSRRRRSTTDDARLDAGAGTARTHRPRPPVRGDLRSRPASECAALASA